MSTDIAASNLKPRNFGHVHGIELREIGARYFYKKIFLKTGKKA